MAKPIGETIAPRRLIVIGTYLLGFLFSVAGAWLTYLGSRGSTEVTFLGTSLNSATGPAILFLAAATVAGAVLLQLKNQLGRPGSSRESEQQLGGPGLASFSNRQPARPSPAGDTTEESASSSGTGKIKEQPKSPASSESEQRDSPSSLSLRTGLRGPDASSKNKPVIFSKEPSMGIDTQALKSKIKSAISAHQSRITKLEDDLKTVEQVERLATELDAAEEQSAEAPGNARPADEEPKKTRAAVAS